LSRGLAALACALALAVPAQAQQQLPNVLFKGLLRATDAASGYDEDTKIACRGMPTCTGTYVAHVRQAGCSNYLDQSGDVTFTSLNLTQSGPLQGRLTTTTPDIRRLANGTCVHTGQVISESLSYTGTWNLATQKGTLHIVGPTQGDESDVVFIADLVAPAEIFPLTVRSQIGQQTATVTADLRFKNEDVGRVGSVYVFASAPAPRVLNGFSAKAVKLGMSSKADTPCVLAQLNSQGQLVAATVGQLSAFVTGAFAAAGTAVSILNNTPVPGVAGATFYVGYGTSSNLMLDSGVFRNAALVPGSSTCPPLPYVTSLWWNPSESGWGLNLSHQGTILFATLFTYDSARAPLWLVMPAGTMQPDGLSFTGALYRTTGPAFDANPFTPIGAANITQVGTMTVALTEANAATLTYTMNGVQVEKNIQRQVYGTRAAVCLPGDGMRTTATNYQDLWWNAAESGWGINVTHQDNTFFATLFTYDPGGRDLWLVLPAGLRQADGSYFGELYRTTGSPFSTQPFPPIGGGDVTSVGNMRLRFTDGEHGTLTYVYDGVTVTKAIARQVFAAPVSACN
jgi:hypothetical protein